MGLLTLEKEELLDATSWRKNNYPLLTSRSVEGEYGPGHNSYVEDGCGNLWNIYHVKQGVDGPRSTGIRRVHFDIDGEPVLDMTEELDVKKELKQIKTKIHVTGTK